MSDGPDLSDAEALAAEHALRVLTGPERAEAEARMARDPAFAALVEAWRARLNGLLDEVAPVAPPARLWPAIARALPANDNARALRFWRAATGGAVALAAASLALTVMVANRPPTVLERTVQAPMLNASLMSQSSGRPMFVAAYDPMRQALIVTSLMPPGGDPLHVHQLWLIPADGKPRSLGMVTPGAKAMPMPPPMAPMLQPGASLVVSLEPPGGSPRPDGPSGPIAAAGKFTRI